MSWNGTVYCGYCGNQGHNRRGCERLKDYVKENPNSYTAQQHNARKMASKKSRSCSYCSEAGHTRRKCEMKNDHIAEFTKRNKKYAMEFAVWLKEEGIEPGSLVAVEEREWNFDTKVYDNERHIYMIVGVDYAKVNIETMLKLGNNWGNALVLKMKRVKEMNSDFTPRYELPHHFDLNNLANYHGDVKERYKVISKVKSCAAYPADMPANFLTGQYGVTELFDGGKHSEKRNRLINVRNGQQYDDLMERRKSEKSENNIE
jgi:hypothetical protein